MVDDEETVFKIIQRTFAPEGYHHIFTVSNSSHAKEFIQRDTIKNIF